MAEDRMAVLDTVRKAIAEGDVDFLREGVRVLAQAVMEAEVTELTGAAKGERAPGPPPDEPQRLSGAALGHPGGHPRARDPEGPRRVVLPLAPRAPTTGRAGPPRGRPGGVRPRGVDPAGRGPRRRPRDRLDQQERGLPDLRRPRRRGRRVPEPAPGRALPVPLARRDVREGPRGGEGRVDGRPRRDRGGGVGRAPGPRPGARGGQRRGLGLARLHPGARGARPDRRPPRHQRRPPRAW